jgi:hypothetical protein
MDFVLSSILMGFVILLNNIVNLDLKLSQVINVALFLGCLMVCIILLKEFIMPFFYRLQTRKKIKRINSTTQGQ